MLPFVFPNDAQSNWASRVNDHAHSTRIARSSDYDVRHTKWGTTITQKQSAKVNDIPGGYLPVTWSRAAHAGVGDVQLVISGLTDMPTGSNSGSFPTQWVCEVNVPDRNISDYILANPSQFLSVDTSSYVRIPGVNYEPQFPEPTSSATPSNPHGRYWRALSSTGGTSPYAIFDESSSYSTGTEVWVDPNKSYSISFYDTNSGNFPPLCAGAFRVVNDVPAAGTGSRPSGNLYYPFYPTWDDSATVTVSGSVKNQIYFRPINPLSPLTFCSPSGETLSGFGSFIPTGSTYSFSLPYP